MENSKILSQQIIKEKGLDKILEKNNKKIKNKIKKHTKIKEKNDINEKKEKNEIKNKKEFIPLILNEDEKDNNENSFDEIINM